MSNPFVFMACGEYNQISGSTMAAGIFSSMSIFHLLGKTYCLILHTTTTSPAFFLSHYKMILFCAHLVIFNRTMNIWREKGWPIWMGSQLQKNENNSINIAASLCNGMCVSLQLGNPTQDEPSIWTHWFKHPRAQMQAHNIHLYELLCHVYSGSMEHWDLKSLSKGTSHIVTFSWDRRAQIEDEWRMMGADAGFRNVSPQLLRLCMRRHTNERS